MSRRNEEEDTVSKLIEKLERISEGRAQPIGFGAAANRTTIPPMLVIASLPAGSAKPDEVAAKADADAFVLTIDNWKKEKDTLARIGGKADVLWGVSLQVISREEIDQLAEMKCDFVIFTPEKTPAAVLGDERVGKVLQIDTSMDDSLARAVARLSVDAVLLSPPGKDQSPLTIHQLMVYERLAAGSGKYLLAALPPGSPADDLESWWSLGVRGVVVDMTADHADEKLSQVKEAIKKLPTTKKRAGSKVSAILPLISEPSTVAPPEEDDDDDDI